MTIEFCSLQRVVTKVQQLFTVATCVRPRKAKFEGVLLTEIHTIEVCLQEDVLFASCSFLRTGYRRRFVSWKGIMLGGRTCLWHRVCYFWEVQDEVLEHCVSIFRGAVCLILFLLEDSESPHSSFGWRIHSRCESEDIRWIDRLVRSPDLTPINHVWSLLETAIATRFHILLPYGTWKQHSWRNGSGLHRDSKWPIFSIHSRCETCITARWNHSNPSFRYWKFDFRFPFPNESYSRSFVYTIFFIWLFVLYYI